MASTLLRFIDHTQRRITVGRTPLDEWSACRRDLYLTTHNTHNRQTSMPLAGFEPTISVGKHSQDILTFHYIWTITVGFVRDLLTIFLQSFEIGHYTLTYHGTKIWKYCLTELSTKRISADW